MNVTRIPLRPLVSRALRERKVGPSDDRPARGLHFALALQTVKCFHRLNGIVGFRPDQPTTDNCEQVDEATLAQKAVEKSLADPVFCG